jgi:hypothetical protein
MIASAPYNPDRRTSFADDLSREIERIFFALKQLNHAEYSQALDFVKVNAKPITHIYAGKPHALDRALRFVLSQVRQRKPK